jgi:hypothetical protein
MNSKPTLLYYFTHQYLRDVVQEHYAFFDSVVRLGGKLLEKVIRQTFEALKNYDLSETDVALEDNDFSTSMAFLSQKKIPLLVIKLPKPRNTAEASYVGIVHSRPIRFFTLELHAPNEMEKQINPNAETKYLLAEWSKKEHKLLNQSWPEPDSAKFSGAIEKILVSAD